MKTQATKIYGIHGKQSFGGTFIRLSAYIKKKIKEKPNKQFNYEPCGLGKTRTNNNQKQQIWRNNQDLGRN